MCQGVNGVNGVLVWSILDLLEQTDLEHHKTGVRYQISFHIPVTRE